MTARRVAESAQDVPVSITTISGEDLQARVVQSAADLAFVTPSLQLVQPATSSQGFYAQMRGQAQTTTDANSPGSVALYFGDVYLGGANLSGALISTNDLQRVEALKGPQGTLYGRNSTGGLITFVPNLPVDEFEAYIRGGIGTYNRRELEGMVNFPLGDNIAVRLNGEVVDRDGYYTDINNEGRDLNDDHHYSLRGAVQADLTDRFQVRLQGWYGHGTTNGPDVRTSYVNPNAVFAVKNIIANEGLGGLTPLEVFLLDPTSAQYAQLRDQALALVTQYYNAPNDQARQTPNNALDQGGEAQMWGGALTLAYDLDWVTLRSITAYTDSFRQSAFNVGGGPWIPIFTRQRGSVEQWTQEFQATGSLLDDRLDFAVGVYLLWADVEDSRNLSGQHSTFPNWLGQYGIGAVPGIDPQAMPSGSLGLNFSEVTSLAPYGQISFEVVPDLTITGGLRYTDEDFTMTTRQIQFNNAGVGTCNSPAPTTAATPVAACQATSDTANFSNLSYLFGVDYQVTPDILLYAKRSRGFRAGGVNGYGSAGLPFISYDPEVNVDHEIGLKSEFANGRVRFNIDYWHTDYSGIQRTVTIVIAPSVPGGPSQFATGIQNAASATLQGVEFELVTNPTDGLTLGVSGAWTDAQYDEYTVFDADYPGNTLDLSSQEFQGVPEWTFTLFGSYEVPTSFGSVRLAMDYAWRDDASTFGQDSIAAFPGGPVTPDQFTTQESYGLLNGSLTFDIEEHDLSIRIWGRNLTNERYVESSIGLVSIGLGYAWDNFGARRTYGFYDIARF